MTQRAAVTVVGAGWAGLSCAHFLMQSEARVSLLDAAPQPGGRARSAAIQLGGQSVRLDNGQHMLIGGYQQSLELIDAASQMPLLKRLPLQFESPTMSISRRGPGRAGLLWGVMTGRGLTTAHRWAMARAGIAFARRRWTGFTGMTVTTLLTMTAQPPDLIDSLWRPLCVAALNTEPAQACAQTFVNVLHDALFIDGASSDFLISQQPLGDLLPIPLLSQLRARGMTWLASHRVQSLATNPDGGWQLRCRGQTISAATIVLATPWHVTAGLLATVAPRAATALHHLKAEPIRTVYLAWPASAKLQLPQMAMLTEKTDQGWHGQWLFDRGVQNGLQLAAVVVSAAGPIAADNNSVAASVARQACAQTGLPPPSDQQCVNEKRATFLCTPDRPVVTATQVAEHQLPRGLFLAGDYCLHRYPATLEAATVSGRLAAEAVSEHLH
ncbi:MAG: hydroxysqualene dehydroxylase HpnE [Burkholderiaceae bacterium]